MYPSINLEKDKKLAEIFGIILGDGNLSKNGNTITIKLNIIKEPRYVNYVMALSREIFKKNPNIQNLPNNQAIQLRINSKELVRKLVLLGLQKGDKVKNQVGVPEWIKINRDFCKGCLKGLLDTDGSIFPVISEKTIKMNFKNNSKPLVNDFKYMCEILDIRVSKIIEGITDSFRDKKFKFYKVHIGAKDQVAKFLYLVKPMKWEYRWRNINIIFKQKGLSIEDAFKYKLEKELRYFPQKLIENLRINSKDFF
ncbi:MAG: hypothetical protein EU532_11225 [Promethearchaeota archaeon]|nr:MAG: hypothetical protein EU532_11225 [Candidatus Lokiarchaeota archaeon]